MAQDGEWIVAGEKEKKKKAQKVQLIRNSYTVALAAAFNPHFASSEAEAQQKSILRGGVDDYSAYGERNTVLRGGSDAIIATIGGQPRSKIVFGDDNKFTLVLNAVTCWVVRMMVGSDGSYVVSSVQFGQADVTIKGYVEPAGDDQLPRLLVTGIQG